MQFAHLPDETVGLVTVPDVSSNRAWQEARKNKKATVPESLLFCFDLCHCHCCDLRTSLNDESVIKLCRTITNYTICTARNCPWCYRNMCDVKLGFPLHWSHPSNGQNYLTGLHKYYSHCSITWSVTYHIIETQIREGSINIVTVWSGIRRLIAMKNSQLLV